jgi:dinuclear metal center YbgI/SA1388 family protein
MLGPVLLQDLLAVLDRIAPLRHAEPWDNVGLITGDPGAAVDRVLVTIDLTSAVLDEAAKLGAGLVVAYHPPVFEGLKRIRHEHVIRRAIRGDIAVWSPHTALDVAPGGTNDVLAAAIGIAAPAPLKVTVPTEGLGIGRVGDLASPSPRAAVLDRIKRELGLSALLVAGPVDGDVTRAAVCAGAGRSLLGDAIAQKVDLFLTGELPHHDALKAAAAGVTVACALHSNSERATLAKLAERIREGASGVDVSVSEVDRDPFVVR